MLNQVPNSGKRGSAFASTPLNCFCAVIIACTVFLIYSPALSGDFVLDDRQLMSSELITIPGGLYRLWFTTQGDDYWPVTSTSFWIEWRLWRLDPRGYHVT